MSEANHRKRVREELNTKIQNEVEGRPWVRTGPRSTEVWKEGGTYFARLTEAPEGDVPESVTDVVASYEPGQELSEREIQETPIEDGDVQIKAELSGGVEDLSRFDPSKDNVFKASSMGGTGLTLYESGEYEEKIGRVSFADDDMVALFEQAIGTDEFGVDVVGSETVRERREGRAARRDLREAAREQIEANPDTSLDDVSIDARAGDNPAIVFQDPDTGRTETIDLEGDSPEAAVDAVDSFDPSDAGDATSPTTHSRASDGIDNRVIAAGVAVIGLLLYGATA
jgi:hypothetical protein